MTTTLEDELLHDELPHEEMPPATEPDHDILISVAARGQVGTAGRQGIMNTAVVNASNPIQQVLSRDYARTKAYVCAVDNPCVLATTRSSALNGQTNQVASPATTPVPSTSIYLPVGSYIPVDNGDELWAAMIGSSPTRVSTIVSRRADEHKPAA
jgi:hypothetical protein